MALKFDVSSKPTLTTAQVVERITRAESAVWQAHREHALERRRLEIAAGDPDRAIAAAELQKFTTGGGE